MGIFKAINNYRELGHTEFMKRFSQGVETVSPLEQVRIQLMGQCIVMFGILVGIGTTLFYKQWWLLIILIGSLLVNGASLIGSYQKYKVLTNFEQAVMSYE